MHHMDVALDTDLAYLAGLIDGEGYVGIKKTTRRDMTSPAYHERIQVRMVDEAAIAFLASTLGGNYYCEASHVAQGRPLYCYQASDLKACQVLDAVLPYLRIKRPDADLVLQLRALKAAKRTKLVGYRADRWGGLTVPTYTLDDANIAARDDLYVRCKALHHAPV